MRKFNLSGKTEKLNITRKVFSLFLMLFFLPLPIQSGMLWRHTPLTQVSQAYVIFNLNYEIIKWLFAAKAGWLPNMQFFVEYSPFAGRFLRHAVFYFRVDGNQSRVLLAVSNVPVTLVLSAQVLLNFTFTLN